MGIKPFSRHGLCTLFMIVVFWQSASCVAGPGQYEQLRERMVQKQIAARGVDDPRVLSAMRTVPRHEFVPEQYRAFAYDDSPLPIGKGQTISQPYIIALMTEVLELKPGEKVLEIGTGSGYQAAVLAEIGAEVYTMEIIEQLGERARKILSALGYGEVRVKIGDGYKGWPQKAPFDAVIVTCAPDEIPRALIDQLRPGGRLVIPVGSSWCGQNLILGVRKKEGLEKKKLIPVRFVPMVKAKD
ncbi:MAG: protein-L-isoaspartate(D-aspartate) O-methyltransferase [Desulfobia sp.]